MKGVLIEEELISLLNNVDTSFRSGKGLEALKLCLIEGKSRREAMRLTGVHRTKIVAAEKDILNAWRRKIAKTI